MNEDKKEKRARRLLSPPFLIQMTSSEQNKNCDLYNHGSIHTVRKCNEGHMWVDGRVSTISNKFSFEVISEKPEIKMCPACKNEFPEDWPFIYNRRELTCIRCYERYNLTGDRDAYHDVLRKQFMIEYNSNQPIELILEQTWSKSSNDENVWVASGWGEPEQFELFEILKYDELNNPIKARFIKKLFK